MPTPHAEPVAGTHRSHASHRRRRSIGIFSTIVSSGSRSGAADLDAAGRVLVLSDANGQQGVSSPLWSHRHAVQFAREQIAERSKVVRVETPTGVVKADDVATRLASDDYR